jgi:hypothetical protein
MQRVEDNEEIIERVAAIDIGKAELVACVRVPDPGRPGRRRQEIIHSSTLTPRLLGLADRLHELGDPGGHGGHLGLLEAGGAPRGARNRAGVKGLRRWSVVAGR